MHQCGNGANAAVVAGLVGKRKKEGFVFVFGVLRGEKVRLANASIDATQALMRVRQSVVASRAIAVRVARRPK